MASTKATELAQLSRKLTYNEATDDAIIPTGTILTTGDSTDDLQEGSTNLYFLDSRARSALSAGTGITYNSTTGEIATVQDISTTSNPTFADVTVDSVIFGATPDASLAWDSVHGTVSITYDSSSVTNKLGQTTHFYVKATSAITKGQLVMFAGAQGDHILAAPADPSAVGFLPEWVIGVADQAFATNDFGYVVSQGTVTGVNTSGFTAGDLLYMHPTTVGALTNSEPAVPNHSILVAAALNSTNNGSIYIRISHKSDLDELHGVAITSKASGDVLVWNGTNWVNDAGYYTSSETDTAITTAINSLIDSAPGALDTLNELAAALGDDPNFATTVTNSIATKVDKINITGASVGAALAVPVITYNTQGQITAATTAAITTADINSLNVNADTVDGKHYDEIISEATALAIALG